MRIRVKLILAVLPPFLAALLLSGLGACLAARHGAIRAAEERLGLKARALEAYALSRWEPLSEEERSGRPDRAEASRQAVRVYAAALLRRESEMILAIDASGAVALQSGGAGVGEEERAALAERLRQTPDGWMELQAGGVERVAQAFLFPPFGWQVLVSEEKAAVYRPVTRLMMQSAAVAAAAVLLVLALLLAGGGSLARILRQVTGAMDQLTGDAGLSNRVKANRRDEAGKLARAFNAMANRLEQAGGQARRQVAAATRARSREQAIRIVFQKYAPRQVVERFLGTPEPRLVGESRVVAVLSAGIHGFVRLSRELAPAEAVGLLNRCFGPMVEVIAGRRGLVDKYIGEAVLAFFGTPVQRADDARQAVLAALDLLQALEPLRREQESAGRPGFQLGIGLSYGAATVGHIGCERRMEYTVIGEVVDLASRLERLTAAYQQEILFSESVFARVRKSLPCRLIDKVQIDGRGRGVRIYTARRTLADPAREAWNHYHTGLRHYYRRDFQMAIQRFRMVQRLLAGDPVSAMYIRRCTACLRNPPPPGWQGTALVSGR